jgi:hypothetical protein
VLDAQRQRVTPMSLIVWSLLCLSVPGSHSNVTSWPRPSASFVDAVDQPVELLVRKVRRRAAAEVNELELPPSARPAGVQRDLARQR